MSEISDTKKIDFLVNRRYPDAAAWTFPPSLNSKTPGPSFENRKRKVLEIKAYRDELKQKTSTALDEIYQAEFKEAASLSARYAALEEASRFFNQPGSLADFDHWGKAAYWSLDEAIALSFGKNPFSVKWESIRPYIKLSPFAREYDQRRDLALRAKNAGILFESVWPGTFLAWAKRINIDYPVELESSVKNYGGQIADWQELYNQAIALSEAEKKLSADQSEYFAKEKASLEEEIARLKKEIDDSRKSEKPLAAREKETLFKLVIGLASATYGYEMGKRFGKLSELKGDLELKGISIDEDTIRKWLNEAADYLPKDSPGKRN